MKRKFARRRLDRPCKRRKVRSCFRSTIRRLDAAQRVNYLAQALAAFQRAVRAHRELIKLEGVAHAMQIQKKLKLRGGAWALE